MNQEDLNFMAEILEKSKWLLYGDLEQTFSTFLKRVFAHELKDWGFGDVNMSDDFATAYWLLIAELNALNLVDYGTSPRGCWLTKEGERFKSIILAHDDAISEANTYIYKKYNS